MYIKKIVESRCINNRFIIELLTSWIGIEW